MLKMSRGTTSRFMRLYWFAARHAGERRLEASTFELPANVKRHCDADLVLSENGGCR